jgi:type IV pilus assembly protein PilE
LIEMITTGSTPINRLRTNHGGTPTGRYSRASGFTLLELMIAVAIVGILATIAYASYVNQVVNSRRAAAATCLQERAQFMERYFTTNLTYAGAPAPAQCPDIAAFYTIGFVGVPDARTYQIRAVPLGIQLARDGECGTLALNAQGVRSASGTSSANPEACW